MHVDGGCVSSTRFLLEKRMVDLILVEIYMMFLHIDV